MVCSDLGYQNPIAVDDQKNVQMKRTYGAIYEEEMMEMYYTIK